MNENAFIIKSNRFYGHYQVMYPCGQRVDCHNYTTAVSIRDRANSQAAKKKENKEKPMNNKTITDIQGVIDILEDILEEITDVHERRPIIQVIQFCQRQQAAGRPLSDIIYWLQRELPKGIDKALGDL
jgi:hypothetical protein